MNTLEKYLQKNPKVKNIIFDFDDTIVSLQLDWENFMQSWPDEIEGRTGVQVPASATQMNHPELVNALVKKYGDLIIEADRKIYEDFEEDGRDSFQQNIELIKFIQNNHSKYKFYMWSSNTRLTITTILEKIGVMNMFDKVVSRDDVEYVKPDSDGFRLIVDPNDFDESTFLFSGNDLYSDKGAANACGIDFFHIDGWQNV